MTVKIQKALLALNAAILESGEDPREVVLMVRPDFWDRLQQSGINFPTVQKFFQPMTRNYFRLSNIRVQKLHRSTDFKGQ